MTATAARKRNRTYDTWHAMVKRCNNPRHPSFKNYGARGIAVCHGFLTFQDFEAKLPARPSPNHSLDRINNDQGYNCGACGECEAFGRQLNVRWATRIEQNLNRRQSRPSRYRYKGVRNYKARWQAYVTVDSRQRHLGTFDTIEDAARAYDKAAREAFGALARLNFS